MPLRQLDDDEEELEEFTSSRNARYEEDMQLFAEEPPEQPEEKSQTLKEMQQQEKERAAYEAWAGRVKTAQILSAVSWSILFNVALLPFATFPSDGECYRFGLLSFQPATYWG